MAATPPCYSLLCCSNLASVGLAPQPGLDYFVNHLLSRSPATVSPISPGPGENATLDFSDTVLPVTSTLFLASVDASSRLTCRRDWTTYPAHVSKSFDPLSRHLRWQP